MRFRNYKLPILWSFAKRYKGASEGCTIQKRYSKTVKSFINLR